ncbi:alpha-glucuronidase family glycosyl hydrolase [Maribacter algicola]|uniref:Alpha-glucuronidase family glycosyl hydrolase n=1 Tax=Meishania litoralis TaxID=3434685 RepID=A0ACC7LLH5_9FLAO
MGFKKFILLSFLCISSAFSQSLEGYDLWLGHAKIQRPSLIEAYNDLASSVYFQDGTSTLKVAKQEMDTALEKMLGRIPDFTNSINSDNTIIVSKGSFLPKAVVKSLQKDLQKIGNEGFVIKSVSHNEKDVLVVTANDDIGILYGIFRLLHLIKTGQSLTGINWVDAPKIDIRMLNHWDNLDRVRPGNLQPSYFQ